MPTPARTSLEDIVRAARGILESTGLAGLTMQAVADRVGVRAPSLYKRVRNRDDLLALIATATAHDLGEQLDDILRASAPDAREQLTELARTLRAFAHERPEQYRLLFTPASAATRPDPPALGHSVAALLDVTTRLVGADHALDAARTVTAWATGFISMEFAGAFRLGGDVERAFEYGITRLADALTTAPADERDRSGHG